MQNKNTTIARRAIRAAGRSFDRTYTDKLARDRRKIKSWFRTDEPDHVKAAILEIVLAYCKEAGLVLEKAEWTTCRNQMLGHTYSALVLVVPADRRA